MIKVFKKHCRELFSDQPGRRFKNYYRRNNRVKPNPIMSVILIGIGLALVIAGAILGFAPGLPGFILGIPGLALIASRAYLLARYLDKGELIVHNIFWKRRDKELITDVRAISNNQKNRE